MTQDEDSSKSSPRTDSVSRPSSSSTQIAVGMPSTPEEELYAAIQGMRDAIRRDSRSKAGEAAAAENIPDTTASPPPSASDEAGSDAAKPHDSEDGPGEKGGGALSPNGNKLAFEDDMSRYPASVTSSVRDHQYEGGLRYHAYHAGKYAFPNDETEQNRDDMKHTMTLMLCRGAYFYSPVEEALERGGEVLDLGTGTGIWVMELGDKYPNSTITGVDLSPIQPTFVPENVHFFVDDFEEEWVDPPEKYDFIHIRHTLHSVKDVEALLTRVMRHLKPGGYFEAQELGAVVQSDDGSLTPETPYALRDYLNFITAGLGALGSDAHAALRLPERMRAAGFEDVRRTAHKCPLGAWPRDKRLRFCGLFLRTAIMDGLRGLSRRPLMALGWTPLQIEMFLIDVRKAIMESDVHAYFTLHVVHGRKPVAG
ncbi:S-adenosyl-L-methionine-dependent methyltransferase [Corynascus similis CBS 632.67]